MELDRTPKREFVPDDLLYKFTNIKKLELGKYFVLMAKTELSNSVSRLGRSQKLLID
jgi:hypothetical protein